MRLEIENRIVQATDLQSQKDAIKKDMDKFANEYARSFLDEKFVAATANLPREWFKHVASIEIHRSLSPTNLIRSMGKEKNWHESYPVEAFPAPMCINIRSITKETDVPAKLKVIIDAAKALIQREKKMRETLRNTLNAYTTVEKLTADFPEFQRHCPQQPAKSYPVAVCKQTVIDMLVASRFDKSLKKPVAKKKPAK